MIETYTFHVSYPQGGDGGPEIRMQSNQADVGTLRSAGGRGGSTRGEIRKATVQMMRTLLVLMQTLAVYCIVCVRYAGAVYSV